MDNTVLVLEKRLPRVFSILSGRRCKRPQTADLKGDWRVVSNRLLGFAGICCKVGPQRVSRFVERGLGVGSTSRGLFSTGWLEATGSSHRARRHRRLPSRVSASRVNTKAAGLMCPAGARRARELASAAWKGARPMVPSVTRPDAGSLSIEEC
jgi:hypothetical protein